MTDAKRESLLSRMFAVAGGLAVAGNVLAAELPAFLAEAARIHGVSPADVSIAIVPLGGVREAGDGKVTMPALRLAWNADRVTAPASTAKLLTTLAGLEILGPDYRWETAFLTDREPGKGQTVGTLYIQGGGDPVLVSEAFARALDRLAQSGVRHIRGDVVVDRSRFQLPPGDPATFDGKGDRPYNQLPDAALVNYRAQSFEFVPLPDGKRARVIVTPVLKGVATPRTIRLGAGPCTEWRTRIGYEMVKGENDLASVRFTGELPVACGPKTFSVVSFQAGDYFERLMRALWEQDGRTWRGHLRAGTVPENAVPVALHHSAPLAEITRSVNKWSNNLIARHIFLTLGDERVERGVENAEENDSAVKPLSPLTLEKSRAVLKAWLQAKEIDPDGVTFVENGSGLSRKTRTTAAVMARLLAAGWTSPWMSEFMSSLPVSAVDGTMKKRRAAPARAHIKTGFLSDVRSAGGYVYTRSGERVALFASVSGKAGMLGGTAFLDAVIDWVYRDCED